MLSLVRTLKCVLVAAFVSCAVLCASGEPAQLVGPQGSETLADWLHGEGKDARYVGSAVCAQCHEDKVKSHAGTPMAHALENPGAFELLRSRPRLTFREGPFTYEIATRGGASVFTVSTNGKSISEPIAFSFGQGIVGQTYMVRHGGTYYEVRVSYFRGLDRLDVTIGQPSAVPASLEDAVGRPLGRDEMQSCFGCHAPSAARGGALTLDHVEPGVTCESCHGPGDLHVAAAKAKRYDEPRIFNPGRLAGNDLTQEFCGACHLSFERAMLLPAQGGPNNVRFQAYRLFNSKGHRGSDSRTACVACHDPHEGLEHDSAYYDSKCLACHAATPSSPRTPDRSAPPCPVKASECAACHMPKVEIPGMHASFTDHWIRVAKSGEPVPH